MLSKPPVLGMWLHNPNSSPRPLFNGVSVRLDIKWLPRHMTAVACERPPTRGRARETELLLPRDRRMIRRPRPFCVAGGARPR